MFNLGFPELLVIATIALLVFGPKRLPEIAKGLGKGIKDFKKALSGPDSEDETAKNLPTSDEGHKSESTEKKNS